MGKIAAGASETPGILVLVGPTASGKTAVAIELASMLRAEVISADSRQIYRFMDIGTAKPTEEERRAVPHHFINILNPDAEYSAGTFGADGRRKVNEIVGRGCVPLVAGGSGLYVRALVDGLFEGPSRQEDIRRSLEERLQKEGEAGLLAELRRVDPVTAGGMEPGKPRRILRALEVYMSTGVPISEHHARQNTRRPFRPLIVGLRLARAELYRRIDLRAAEMVETGLVDEVRSLVERGYGRTLNALNTVGYREVFEHFDGLLDPHELVTAIQTHTRQFAKRQLTWFRRDGRIRWLDVEERTEPGALAARIAELWHAFVSR